MFDYVSESESMFPNVTHFIRKFHLPFLCTSCNDSSPTGAAELLRTAAGKFAGDAWERLLRLLTNLPQLWL